MKKFWKNLSVLVFSSVVAVSSVSAQDCIDDTDHSAPRSGLLSYEGEPGVWFRLDVAKCMLADLSTCEANKYEITLLEEKLSVQAEQIELLEKGFAHLELANKELEKALAGEAARANKAEREKNAWYRSPWLWFAVGTVLSAGVIVGVSQL